MSIAMEMSERIARIMDGKVKEVEDRVEKLKKEKDKLANNFKKMDKGDARENGDLDEALKAMASNSAALYAELNQLSNFREIEDLNRYNSTGMIVNYATVYLRWQEKSREPEEGIFRIYPGDISYPELGKISNKEFSPEESSRRKEAGVNLKKEAIFGVISENSIVAKNFMLKSIDDIPKEGLKINGVVYKVMEVY